MVYITHIRLGTAGTGHDRITHVKWKEPTDGTIGDNTIAQMVQWIDNENGDARVQGPPDVRVGTVNPAPKHLRTYADDEWTNNLLDLPEF